MVANVDIDNELRHPYYVEPKVIATLNFQLRTILCLHFLLVQVFAVSGQIHNYTQYTVEHGLPTNYVYGLVEDDRGYIWAYTEQGIARFDGYEWKAFGLSDGLGTLDCYSMCPLKDGTHIVGGKGWPTIVKGDSLFKLPIPEGLHSSSFESSILREGYSPWVRFNAGPNKLVRKNLLVYSADSVKVYDEILNGVFSGPNSRVFETVEQQKVVDDVLKDGFVDYTNNPFYIGKIEGSRFLFWKDPAQYFLDGKIIGDLTRKPDLSFRGLVQDGRFQVYTDSLLYLFDSEMLTVVNEIDMVSWKEKYDVNRAFLAKNGDLWIATRSNGVLHVSSASQQVKFYSGSGNEQMSIEGVNTLGNRVYVADDKSNAYVLEGSHLVSLGLDEIVQKGSRFQFFRKLSKAQLALIRGYEIFSITEEGIKLSGYFHETKLEKIEACLETQIADGSIVGNFIFRIGSHNFVVGKDFQLFESPVHFIKTNEDGTCIPVRSQSRHAYEKRPLINDKEIFVGSESELVRISASSFDTIWTTDSISITALYRIKDNSFLLGTQAKGVFRLELDKDPELTLLFQSKRVKTITKDPSGNYWAATYSGVYRFDEFGEVDLRLTNSNGLPSSETYDLDFFSDSVAVGTANGLAVFDQDVKMEEGGVVLDRHVQLNRIKVNGKLSLSSDNSLILSPGEDDIEFNFSLLDPSSGGDITYEVLLHPYSQESTIQTSRTVRYSQLDAGRYQFTVRAISKNGAVHSLEHPLEINVREYLYKQTWFQLLSLILFGGGAWWLVRIRLREKLLTESERLNNNRRISELQLEALRSQMNPHFVFNALGSIQYYIQSEEKELADSYLTKFAQLMRKYLDSSKRSLVTVKEEVALLTQYIELEKMRYDHAFSYKFVIDEDVDDSDPLPSMILQPFVENAIIHGLANRSEPGGEIVISILEENNKTVVAIEDNGIGIENSKNMKRRGHRSRATEITNDRIVALRNSGSAEIDLAYDVVDPNNLTCPGTKATLRINFHQDED